MRALRALQRAHFGKLVDVMLGNCKSVVGFPRIAVPLSKALIQASRLEMNNTRLQLIIF